MLVVYEFCGRQRGGRPHNIYSRLEKKKNVENEGSVGDTDSEQLGITENRYGDALPEPGGRQGRIVLDARGGLRRTTRAGGGVE